MMREKNTSPADMNIPDAGYKRSPGRVDHVAVIYAIGADADGPIKIGRSTDLWGRINSLQTGSWQTLVAFDIRLALPKNMAGYRFSIRDNADRGASMLERCVHEKLKEIGLHIRGEWFDISAVDALKVMEKCADAASVRCVGVEHLASVMPDRNLDPEVASSHRKLLGELLSIKTMIAAKAKRPIDL